MSEKFQIDIEEILAKKAGKKAKYIPRFITAWLKRIAHQEEVNQFLTQEGDKVGVPWLQDAMQFLNTTLVLQHKDRLPDPADGKRYTFVSNHPLGGIDGVALGAILGEHYKGRIRYLVNDLLMNLPGLAPLCVGINKFGNQNRSFAEQVDATFSSDNHVILFPADLCSRKYNGVIRDVPWKKTFITKSIDFQRDIVPIHFEGKNSNFFYRLTNLSKALGIRFNLAMLFLADEMFRQRGKTFKVTIGEPIPWQTFDKSRSPVEWAAYVQEKVYALPSDSATNI